VWKKDKNGKVKGTGRGGDQNLKYDPYLQLVGPYAQDKRDFISFYARGSKSTKRDKEERRKGRTERERVFGGKLCLVD